MKNNPPSLTKSMHKKTLVLLTILALIACLPAFSQPVTNPPVAAAAPAAPKRADPTVEQRLLDLEAYVNNTARVADTTNNVSSKLGSYDDKANSFTPNPGP